MPKGLIPLRPENFISSLSQEEQTALSWFVLSGCTKKSAYFSFVRPDMYLSNAKAAVDDCVKQFFASKDAKEYIAAYEETIENTLHPKPDKKEENPVPLEERKARAKTKLVEFAMTLVDNVEMADDPEFVLKMADKIGLLDQDEEVVEQPRRYLPVQCISECRYRLFCEENTTDECQFCKYRKYGEENGIHYEPEHQLDVGMEFEGKK